MPHIGGVYGGILIMAAYGAMLAMAELWRKPHDDGMWRKPLIEDVWRNCRLVVHVIPLVAECPRRCETEVIDVLRRLAHHWWKKS